MLCSGKQAARMRVAQEFAARGLKFPKRAYGGVWDGQLIWGHLTDRRVSERAEESGVCRSLRLWSLSLCQARPGQRRGPLASESHASALVAGGDPESPPRLHFLRRTPPQSGHARTQPHERGGYALERTGTRRFGASARAADLRRLRSSADRRGTRATAASIRSMNATGASGRAGRASRA